LLGRLVVLLGLVAATAPLSRVVAAANTHEANGAVLFDANLPGEYEYSSAFMFDPNSPDPQPDRLVGGDQLANSPRMAPDGSTLMYTTLSPGGGYAIGMKDQYGFRLLQQPAGVQREGLDWSPDGTQILYRELPLHTAGGAFWTSAPDGSDAHQLLASSYGFGMARWSPSGDLIALTDDRPSDGDTNVWLIRPDGSGFTPVTIPGVMVTTVYDFSPDGSRLLLQTYEDGVDEVRSLDLSTGSNLVLARQDEPSLQNNWLSGAAWSPDGSSVVIGTYRFDEQTSQLLQSLQIRSASGGQSLYALMSDLPLQAQATELQWLPGTAISTSTSLAVTPTSPTAAGSVETLTATLDPATAGGTIQFKDGNASLGSPVVVSAGVATTSVVLPPGPHSLTAIFTPTPGSAWVAGISPAVPYTVMRYMTHLAVTPVLIDVVKVGGIKINVGWVEADLTGPGGAGIPGQTVIWSAGGQQVCSATTDPNGHAQCAMTLDNTLRTILNLGVAGSYAGDEAYQPAAGQAGIVRL
jgi:hypothetical protein